MKLFSLISFITFLLSSCSGGEKKFDQQSYDQHKESLVDKEKKNPLAFLIVSGDDMKNMIGQTVIHGKITSKATVCSYHDIRIKLLCYKDDKMVEEHEDVVKDIVKPNSGVNFKTRYRLPKGTDSVSLSIMSASIAE